MAIDYQALHAEVDQLEPDIIAQRRYFHQHAEPPLQEFNTAALIKATLDKLGIGWVAVGQTGVMGTLPGGKGPGKTIILRADIDALPLHDGCGSEYVSQNEGVNHACGHDGHIAALLGAATVLVAHRDDFAGTIKFAFQQAEEIGAGAVIFRDGGFLDGADQTFGIHLRSGLEYGKVTSAPGPQNASVDFFGIDIQGHGGHCGRPDRSVDALVAAASVVTELQQIVAREVDPAQPVVVHVGKLQSGSNYNIIAEHARIEGTVRTYDGGVSEHVLDAIQRIATGVAVAHRAAATVEFKHYANVLVNDPRSAEFAAGIIDDLLGEGSAIRFHEPGMGGDDFAEFLLKAPGVYCFVGSGGLPENSHDHHNERFNIDERALAVATKLHIDYALRWLGGGYAG